MKKTLSFFHSQKFRLFSQPTTSFRPQNIWALLITILYTQQLSTCESRDEEKFFFSFENLRERETEKKILCKVVGKDSQRFAEDWIWISWSKGSKTKTTKEGKLWNFSKIILKFLSPSKYFASLWVDFLVWTSRRKHFSALHFSHRRSKKENKIERERS